MYFATASAEKPPLASEECCARLVRVEKTMFDTGYAGAGLVLKFLDVPDIQSAHIDAEFLYFGVLSSRVAAQQTKVRLSDLVTVSTVALDENAGEKNIQAVGADAKYLYLALYTKPGKLVKMLKNGMYSWRSDTDHSQ